MSIFTCQILNWTSEINVFHDNIHFFFPEASAFHAPITLWDKINRLEIQREKSKNNLTEQ